jgi:hypothetical protein
MQEAVLRPAIPASAFQSIKDMTVDFSKANQGAQAPSVLKKNLKEPQSIDGDEWDDGGLNDDDFISAEPREDEFTDVDALDQPNFNLPKARQSTSKTSTANTVDAPNEQRLKNGNLACNHRCKDRSTCKHQCCKAGVEKRAKQRQKKSKDSELSATESNNKSKTSSTSYTNMQPKLELPIRGKVVHGPVEHLDLSQTARAPKGRGPMAATKLASHHNNTTKSSRVSTIGTASVTPVSSTTGKRSRPKFMQSLNPLRSIEEEIHDETPLGTSMLDLFTDDNDKILSDEEDYLDKDEDMLDAALVGLEDSQSLRNSDQVVESTHEYESLDVVDAGMGYQEDYIELELFVTPHQQRIDDFTEGFEDAAAMFDQSIDDQSTMAGKIKRKRDEGVPSAYFSAKKARMDDEEELQIYAEQSHEEEMGETDEEDKESKERREKEELRAWLAAELGDCVEMI